jgi:predicted dehydrogenase
MLPLAPSIYANLPKPYRIGIAGAGAIVKAAHLPAYRKAGFPVAAIFDIDYAKASALATEFSIPRVCRSLEELLGEPLVEVVDIALPPACQPEIAEQALRHEKHVLCQKPLAESTEIARKLVRTARDAGVQLAVNVNMRWDPAMQETECQIRHGRIGELESADFVIRYYEHWHLWPWLVSSPRLLFEYDTIHMIDVVRKLFGEPVEVNARLNSGGQRGLRGETAGIIEFRCGQGRTVRIESDSNVDPSRTEARFTIRGSRGVIRGTLGIYYDYPHGQPDTWCLTRADATESTRFEERWIPDAFAGTMAELFRSIEQKRPPSNSGDDHVKTLRLLDVIYEAAQAESWLSPEASGNGENRP